MRKLTEQEEKEYFDKYKPTLKYKMEDWLDRFVDKIDDNAIIIILSLYAIIGILALIKFILI